jgi:hypothetical protein
MGNSNGDSSSVEDLEQKARGLIFETLTLIDRVPKDKLFEIKKYLENIISVAKMSMIGVKTEKAQAVSEGVPR